MKLNATIPPISISSEDKCKAEAAADKLKMSHTEFYRQAILEKTGATLNPDWNKVKDTLRKIFYE